LEVARETSWRWQERRLGGGKRDVLEVARETSWRWQERRLGGGKRRGGRLGGGKRDILEVARETLRGISSDVVAMGDTLGGGKSDVLEVARETSWRWKERRLGGGKRETSCGKRDVKRYQLRHGFYGSDTPRRRNSDCVVGI
jgi:hypothetical protein